MTGDESFFLDSKLRHFTTVQNNQESRLIYCTWEVIDKMAIFAVFFSVVDRSAFGLHFLPVDRHNIKFIDLKRHVENND